MEYIECTHCGKRYAANEKIHASEGEFVRCKNCLEKFMIVVHDSEKRGLASDDDELGATGDWDPTLTAPPQDAAALAGHEQSEESEQDIAQPVSESNEDDSVMEWDPSLTMPTNDSENEDDEAEQLSDEEIQAQAEASLAAVKQEKKKKIILYSVLGATLVLLALTLYMAFLGNEEEQAVSTQVETVKHISPEELDKDSPECRAAAARQWLLDYKAMHGNYDAQTFENMLEQSQFRTDDVRKACKAPRLLKNILDTATAGERPDWFAKEIQTYSKK